MKYFLGIQIFTYPWVRWTKVGDFATTEDFEASEWFGNPLVKAKADIVQTFGTYTFHIVDGVFVDRTEEELTDLEADYNVKNVMSTNRARIETLRESTFTYDSKQFPMDEASRLFYSTFTEIPGDKKVIPVNETEFYSLLEANIPSFLGKYYEKLKIVTEHDN